MPPPVARSKGRSAAKPTGRTAGFRLACRQRFRLVLPTQGSYWRSVAEWYVPDGYRAGCERIRVLRRVGEGGVTPCPHCHTGTMAIVARVPTVRDRPGVGSTPAFEDSSRSSAPRPPAPPRLLGRSSPAGREPASGPTITSFSRARHADSPPSPSGRPSQDPIVTRVRRGLAAFKPHSSERGPSTSRGFVQSAFIRHAKHGG
jgi:hypothetical protein